MSGIVKLDVGESRAPFDVHLELLCACSPYFNSLFGKRTEKSLGDQAVYLPDLERDIFAEIVLWMYRGKNYLRALHRKDINLLLKMWLLAGNLEMPELQDSLMPLLKERAEENTQEFLCNDAVGLIYAQSMPSSPLRHLLVDIYIHGSKAERSAISIRESPRQFLEDICSVLPEEGKEWDRFSLPSLDQTNRYFVNPLMAQTDFKGLREDTPEIRQLATPAQMSSRKIKNLPTRQRNAVQKSFEEGNKAEAIEGL